MLTIVIDQKSQENEISLPSLEKAHALFSLNKIQILALMQKEITISEISKKTNRPKSNISRDVALLLKHQVIKERKEGRFKYYSFPHKIIKLPYAQIKL